MNSVENDWKNSYIQDFGYPKYKCDSWITGYEVRRQAETRLCQVELRYIPDKDKPYDNISLGIFGSAVESKIWTIVATIMNEDIKKHENIYNICQSMIEKYNSFQKKVKVKEPYSWNDIEKVCTSPLLNEKMVIINTPIFS